jgi:hypothetical protein
MKLKFDNIKKLVLKNKIICLIIITILIVIGCIIVYKSCKTIEKFNDNCNLEKGGDCNNLKLNFYDTNGNLTDKTFDVDLSGTSKASNGYRKYIFTEKKKKSMKLIRKY